MTAFLCLCIYVCEGVRHGEGIAHFVHVCEDWKKTLGVVLTNASQQTPFRQVPS